MKKKPIDRYQSRFYVWLGLYVLFTIMCLIGAWYAPSHFWRAVTLAGFVLGSLLVWGLTQAWKLFKQVLEEIEKGL